MPAMGHIIPFVAIRKVWKKIPEKSSGYLINFVI